MNEPGIWFVTETLATLPHHLGRKLAEHPTNAAFLEDYYTMMMSETAENDPNQKTGRKVNLYFLKTSDADHESIDALLTVLEDCECTQDFIDVFVLAFNSGFWNLCIVWGGAEAEMPVAKERWLHLVE